MGQKQSKSAVFARFLSPLPEYYEKNQLSEVYSIRNQNQTCIQSTSPQIPHPETLPSKEKHEQQEIIDSKTVRSEKSSYIDGVPSHLRHFIMILNDFQTKDYLNHLIYRNQPEFREFIVQVPFGEIEKHQKYTKIHLYAQEVALTLNHVSNLPFHDMCIILYTSLIAYKYLYSYFGLFKIEENMIGFTREGKTKVWINHKLTKDKPLPIVTDINLKRFKQQENYMVDDLLTIFWNKVDRETVPRNFNLINKFSSIRSSRHVPSRLSLSKIQNEAELSQSMARFLQNNLVQDFSQGSFDKCLEYLERFLNIQRPEFLKIQSNQNPQVQEVEASISKQSPMSSQKALPFRNFVPSVEYLVKNRKEFTRQSADLRSSTANFNLNFRQVGPSSDQPQFKKTQSSKYQPQLNQSSFQKNKNLNSKIYDVIQSRPSSIGLVEQSICRPLDLQNSRPTSFGLPVESIFKMKDQTVYKTEIIQNSTPPKQQSAPQSTQLQSSSLISPNKAQKISMRAMMQPILSSSVQAIDSVNNSLNFNQQKGVQKSQSYSTMNFSQKIPVSMNGSHYDKNMMNSQVQPYQISGMKDGQRINQSSQFQTQSFQIPNTQSVYQQNQNTAINRVVRL